VRLVVGYGAGGTADTIARVLASGMSEKLGQQVVVENRTGAGGMLAARDVARAKNDGHTLLLATNAYLHPFTTPSAGASFNFVKDFYPITFAVTTPALIAVHPSLNVKTVREFIDLAKAKPDMISFATGGGTGTTVHLILELFKSRADIQVTHIPYPASPVGLADFLAGRVHAFIAPAPMMLEHIKEGKVVALAITGSRPMPLAPAIPTMGEAGFANFDVTLWMGLAAPSGTPPNIIEKLAQAANETLKSEDAIKILRPLGFTVVGSTPEEFRRSAAAEVSLWANVGEKAGLKK
jgi:tripartite-type tricarboxylate transporter receptor subunit TctC